MPSFNYDFPYSTKKLPVFAENVVASSQHLAATAGLPQASLFWCAGCQGSGKIRAQQGFFLIERTCPTCGGTGKTIKNPCKICTGAGRVQREVHELREADPTAGLRDGVADVGGEPFAVCDGIGGRRWKMGEVIGKQAMNHP